MRYNEEIFASEDEALVAFREQSMVTKEDILSNVRWRKQRFQKEAEEDSLHSGAYYAVLDKLLDRFYTLIENTILFDAPEGWWTYCYEIETTGIKLMLSHYYYVDFDLDGNSGDTEVDTEFVLLTVETKHLSVEEYARLYEVEQGTVRQWIRRGKIRDAIKLGKEWRIPELSEIPKRGYSLGQYEWKEELGDVPEKYKFLKEPAIATFYQDKIDKKIFHISVGEYKKKVDGREREALELFLIGHPLVRYISGTIGLYT